MSVAESNEIAVILGRIKIRPPGSRITQARRILKSRETSREAAASSVRPAWEPRRRARPPALVLS